MSPYIIFGGSRRCLLKNLLDPPKNLFQQHRSFTTAPLGLFATKPIGRGVYIATYRGWRISTEEADRREVRGARYMFELNSQWTIDGSPGTGNGPF